MFRGLPCRGCCYIQTLAWLARNRKHTLFFEEIRIRKGSISVIANDEGYSQSQCRFPSILAKDPPTHHHGLRMDRNRHYEGCHSSQRRLPSILAKDPPTLHHGLRMDRNRHFTPYLDEISSFINVLEMLLSSHFYWNIILEKEYRK